MCKGRIEIILYIICVISLLYSNAAEKCLTDSGENGLCKRYSICENAQKLNRTGGIAPTICGYLFRESSRREAVVCCTDINALLKPSASDWYFPGMKMFEKKCQEYSAEKHRMILIQNEVSASNIGCINGTCNYFATPYAIGGVNAAVDEFPHMAEIGWERRDGNGFNWKCGGSLISDQYILTAAHCLYVEDAEHKTAEPTMIRLGESVPIQMKIDSAIPHPDYKPPKKYNDIALIRLSSQIGFSLKIHPACLLANSTLVGNATTIGWGITTLGGGRPERLQKVSVDLFNRSLCRQGYQLSRSLPIGIIDSQFCAGYQSGGRDACQGDSGSPIQVVNNFDRNLFDIIGVTSFGNGCGSKYGGVYTKISSYIAWIESYVWPYGHVLEKYYTGNR